MGKYSETMMDHVLSPRNSGVMGHARPDRACRNARARGISDLSLRNAEGRIAAAKYHTVGCGPTIACASMLSELVLGRSIAECRELTAEDLIEALDGVPPDKLHCPALAIGALRMYSAIGNSGKIFDHGSLGYQGWEDHVGTDGRLEKAGDHGEIREVFYVRENAASVKKSLHVRCRFLLPVPAIPEEILSTEGTESHGKGRANSVTRRTSMRIIRPRESGGHSERSQGHLERCVGDHTFAYDHCFIPCHSVPSVDNKLRCRGHTDCLGVVGQASPHFI